MNKSATSGPNKDDEYRFQKLDVRQFIYNVHQPHQFALICHLVEHAEIIATGDPKKDD